MCGQLSTICKKYGVQLNRLSQMYGDEKRFYAKFHADNYDPQEFETAGFALQGADRVAPRV